MPDWILSEADVTEVGTPDTGVLQEQLRAEQENNLLLTESVADLQLALEDKGWRSIAHAVQADFTPEARKALITLCRTMAISNPLIKRGLQVRTGYVWGQGVQVRARAAGDEQAQDVNAVVQGFLDANTATLTGDVAHAKLEHGVGTDGNVYLTCFTNPLTGAVQVRTALAEEVVDVITNPDDRDDPWYYVRRVAQRVVEPGTVRADGSRQTRTRAQVVKVFHPAVGFWPRTRPKTIDGATVRWDAPILHVKVNEVAGWRFGVPDVYASIAWARSYKDFLVDWAQLTRSLSQYAWRATAGNGSRAQKLAASLNAQRQPVPGVPPIGAPAEQQAGRAAVGTPDVHLEAIPKSGATIDADSGRPLAGMAAAGLGLPVTMLLADPGVTGARAVAETLDLPTILEMGMRRLMWQSSLTRLVEYVIDQAVLAPRGALRGSMARDDWGRLTTVLTGEVERTLDWDWPPLVDIDPVALIKAIVEASGTQLVPKPVLLRLLLNALGVKDVDEVIDAVTDEQGDFIDPEVTAAAAAVEAARRGRTS
ncbi:hypothetical protein [Nocardioides sp. AX2bis]|uniref:hypothetical protein n=1 Tax=Nocardioides sp. AX2bis TaxID=2653157 RepID=UPI0012F3D87A|nr:hypothetical protein [Nocardioides sp. AX2bis]VXC44482.1 conserved hypothetical protein [Nocardioides sp. AX2bis]